MLLGGDKNHLDAPPLLKIIEQGVSLSMLLHVCNPLHCFRAFASEM